MIKRVKTQQLKAVPSLASTWRHWRGRISFLQAETSAGSRFEVGGDLTEPVQNEKNPNPGVNGEKDLCRLLLMSA